MHSFKILIFLFLCFNCAALQISATVVQIHDGDTITIKSKELKGPKSVRLIGIDTPEVDFNGFTQGEASILARDYLRSILPLSADITIDLGRDGTLNTRRLLGRVIYNGVDINKQVLLSGFAVPYFIDPFDKKIMMDYMNSSKEIFENNKSIYSNDVQIPYEFRMSVQNKIGSNYIGDLDTKKLYYPEESKLVPIHRRLFISSIERANAIGYKLRD